MTTGGAGARPEDKVAMQTRDFVSALIRALPRSRGSNRSRQGSNGNRGKPTNITITIKFK